MPLRSVEAATRDDAIAAAREQFGPTARVVGVRRVRSGGVLGFFATERYVAEVAADAGRSPRRPGVRRVPVRGDAARRVAGRLLLPAGLGRPRAGTRGRARAQRCRRLGRRGGAHLARPPGVRAVSCLFSRAMPRVAAPAPPTSGRPLPRGRPRRHGPGRSRRCRAPTRSGSASSPACWPRSRPTPEMPAVTGARYPRAEFQRADSPRARDEGPGLLDDDFSGGGRGFAVPAASASAAPSPFTAALARMVAGDRDVRQAVREALDDPAAPRPRGDGDSRPARPGALGPADTSVASPATRQKEETVGDQVIAPSTFADQPVEVPAWAAEPEVSRRPCPPGRRPSPRSCAPPWRRGTRTRPSPASCARSSPGCPRRPRWPSRRGCRSAPRPRSSCRCRRRLRRRAGRG